MKRMLFVVLVFILSSSHVVMNAQNRTAESAAQAIFNDIASQEIKQFNWLYYDEAKRMNNRIAKDKGFLEEILLFEKNLSKNLKEVYEYGLKGQKLDWKDVKVTSVEINKDKSIDIPEINGGSYQGTIHFASRGQSMSWKFKNGLVVNGEWRILLPRVLRDIDGNYIPDY